MLFVRDVLWGKVRDTRRQPVTCRCPMKALFWLVVHVAYVIAACRRAIAVRQRAGVDVASTQRRHRRANARGCSARGLCRVLVLDAAKGAVAAALTRLAAIDGGWEFARAAAVSPGLCGPCSSVPRSRGLAPLLGAWLVLDPLAILLSPRPRGSRGCSRAPRTRALRRVPAAGDTWWETREALRARGHGDRIRIVMFTHRSHCSPPFLRVATPRRPPPLTPYSALMKPPAPVGP